MSSRESVRRAVKSCDTRWAQAAASWLRRMGMRPNQISIAGIFFALFGGICFYFLGEPHGM
ncbi:MAG: hypothetical protein HP002_16185 [Lentisphaeria bacterium]|nr:hypothetical protein [Lentisphaeria bacterium]MBS5530717.1 hypothetical protein [bacterium]